MDGWLQGRVIHKPLPPKPWTVTRKRTVLVLRHSSLVWALGLLLIWRKQRLFFELWRTPQTVGSLGRTTWPDEKIRQYVQNSVVGGPFIKYQPHDCSLAFFVHDELRLGFYCKINVHVRTCTMKLWVTQAFTYIMYDELISPYNNSNTINILPSSYINRSRYVKHILSINIFQTTTHGIEFVYTHKTKNIPTAQFSDIPILKGVNQSSPQICKNPVFR